MKTELMIPIAGVLALLYVWYRRRWIMAQPAGSAEMQKISDHIHEGATAFLKTEYKVLGLFVILASILLGFLAYNDEASSPLIIISFISGAFLSALAGYIGMSVATRANVRTTEAAKTSLSKALDVSFAGGSVMGIGVAGLGVLGIILLLLALKNYFVLDVTDHSMVVKVLNIITGFSLGAESIALFARVGGGIFTKAADVGADLVGKVEAGIPEDDPRNPATIADNVGDNVGDVAGMGADLFGSYVSTIIATMVLGASIFSLADPLVSYNAVLLPVLIAAGGILFSIAGTFTVKISETGNPQRALNIGNITAIFLTAIFSYFAITNMLPDTFSMKDHSGNTFDYHAINIFYTVLIGLAVGALISVVTEFYCSMGKRPVNRIAQQSSSGPATNIIAGLSIGMQSTAIPIIILVMGIFFSYEQGGLYGVAMAATGMMATTGIQLAIDAFGPIADNAGGIAQMANLPEKVRERTDILDATGNTTAAIGKGFAIASAALTSLALFAAFMEMTGLKGIDISNPSVLGGLFIGAMIPFLFSSLAMSAVGRAANTMVTEVRRQFREIKGLLEGKEGVEADYKKCVEISTNAAIREMLLPGLLALGAPVCIGLFAGAEVLGGALAGITVAGVLMAIFQSNAGGAWDNAKKMFEKGVVINGETFYKGSEPHKATVIGDTVGDPFKDTSGPAMNILIKLSSIVSLIIAPML
jgi:K(+)-stimulated pyrophosphate-energized sodium pump